MSFVDKYRRNKDPKYELESMIMMAEQMIDILVFVASELKLNGDINDVRDITMRIGIHTGRIIGGVIGKDTVRYDTYGRDQIIASSMESEGVPNHIHISEDSKKLLEQLDPE